MTPGTDQDDQERRSFLLAGLLLLGVILLGVLVVTVTTDGSATNDPRTEEIREGETRPGIIPRPGEGTAPEQPGDRGGWEQLALFGLILVGLAVIAFVVVRGTKRARGGRQAWLDAAEDRST